MTHSRTRTPTKIAILAALAGAALLPSQAKAWWRGGVFIGGPSIVVGPPVVAYPPPYYPPAYYAPPPAYYAPAYPAPAQTPAPQLSQSTPYGSTCYAGFYTCAAPDQSHVGTTCSCAGLGAPSYGYVR